MGREFVRTNKNPYRGVSWHARDGGYRMKITSGSRHLTWKKTFRVKGKDGVPDPAEAAAKVYDVAAQYLRGPDAVLNFDGEAHPAFPCARVKAWLLSRGVPRNQMSEIGVAKTP